MDKIISILSSANALNEFVGWVTPHMKAAVRYAWNISQSSDEENIAAQSGRNILQSPEEYNTAAQRQIQEKIEQLDDKLGTLKSRLLKLKTTMPTMLDLIDKVEWQSHKEQATVLLPAIKDAVYDAEDLLDEFDYYALKLKVECNKNLGQDHLHKAFMEFLNTIDSNLPNNYTSKVNAIQEGSRILVTTRSPEVAKVINPMYHYELPCLKGDIFWEFFKLCAFESTSSSNNRESLECIGKNILPKLKGNPLAAKTIGRLLRMDLSTTHWENIMESELWQVEQTENDILPALRLSYIYLPQNLKKCFSICAMYPKDHKFESGFLADIWTAQGYVEDPKKASLCFNALANRSFFQKASPHSSMFVIHDLMHDTAQLVSKDECFIIKHPRDIDRVPSTVRHLSIFGNGDIECSQLKKICNNKKIRTLVCDDKYNSEADFAGVIDCWFKELLKIRVLKFRVGRVRKLPESMGKSKHLRYFCLLGPSKFGTLPSSVCRLHKLRTIERAGSGIGRFPPGFSDLISLQRINSKGFTYDRDHSDKLCLKWSIIEVGAPSSETVGMEENQMEELPHWNIQHLHVENYKGESCPSWLMPKLLPGLRSLTFDSCGNIKSIPFFVPSEESRDNAEGPHNLNRLEEFVVTDCPQINWQGSIVLPTSLRKLELCVSGCSMDNLVSCFRDLTSLTHLQIRFSSLTSIPLDVWSSNLPSLEDLSIMDCNRLASISASGASSNGVKGFSALANIKFYSCGTLLSLDEFLMPDYLPVVKTISVERCEELTSVSVDRLDGLEMLKILGCHKWRVLSVPSSLRELNLCASDGIEFVDLSNNHSALEVLSIASCPSLRSIGGEAAIAEIKSVRIDHCPNLTEIQQPLERGYFFLR